MAFKPFDRTAERAAYRRHLPHWTQPGCTYFLTFRLADSLPREKLIQWQEERLQWLKARGLNAVDELAVLSPPEQRQFHRHFTKRLHEWLDVGEGSCVLREPRFARIVADALLFFDGQRFAAGDFVIMPNHVHLLATPFGGTLPAGILHSIKRHSAREINKLRGVTGTLWMDETFDHAVRSSEQLAHFRRYIRENPKMARLRNGEFLLGCGTDRE